MVKGLPQGGLLALSDCLEQLLSSQGTLRSGCNRVGSTTIATLPKILAIYIYLYFCFPVFSQ